MSHYISCGGSDQPPAYVKSMGPAPQPIDPRMLAAALQQMGAMQQSPMSTNDGVNITISIEPQGEVYAENYVDPYLMQGQAFADSGYANREAFEVPENHGEVKNRAKRILQRKLGGMG